MDNLVGVFIGLGGLVVAIISVAIACMVFKYSKKKDSTEDVKEESAQDATFRADLEYIKRRTDDTLLEVRDMRKCQSEYNERLTRCEESTKSAHHRIDGIESKIK